MEAVEVVVKVLVGWVVEIKLAEVVGTLREIVAVPLVSALVAVVAVGVVVEVVLSLELAPPWTLSWLGPPSRPRSGRPIYTSDLGLLLLLLIRLLIWRSPVLVPTSLDLTTVDLGHAHPPPTTIVSSRASTASARPACNWVLLLLLQQTGHRQVVELIGGLWQTGSAVVGGGRGGRAGGWVAPLLEPIGHHLLEDVLYV